MSARASTAIFRHEMRILRTDPGTVVFLLVMPLMMTAFMQGMFRAALVGEGVTGATGAELAVPGMGVAFAAFSIGYAGFAFFREHGWGTWERLRASPATSVDILVGKVAPSVLTTTASLGLLFAFGVPLFGFRITGSWLALAVLVLVLALCLNAFGVAVTAISRTSQQLGMYGSLGGAFLAMLGGAFVPVSMMPGWAQTLAPAMPTYWAMRGMRAVVLEGGGMAEIALPVVAMLLFGMAFGVLAGARFRFDDTKIYYG